MLLIVACGNKGGNKPVAPRTETAVNEEETATDSIVFPDFTQTDINGKQVSLHKAISKNVVTLIDFWASWCGPCRAEMPNVVRIYDAYKDKGLGIIGISLDEDAEKWKDAVSQMGMEWTQLSDLRGWDNEISSSLGVRSIPFTVLVDSKARVIAAGLRGNALEEAIKTELEKQAAPATDAKHNRTAAVMNESANSQQLFIPRNQRLLPSFGFHLSKTHARTNSIYKTSVCHLCQTTVPRHDAARYVSPVSRLYYVIALRHLIC